MSDINQDMGSGEQSTTRLSNKYKSWERLTAIVLEVVGNRDFYVIAPASSDPGPGIGAIEDFASSIVVAVRCQGHISHIQGVFACYASWPFCFVVCIDIVPLRPVGQPAVTVARC